MRQIKITQQITQRGSVALDKYLQEIAKKSLLTPEQEVELARRIKEGDEEAMQQLVMANLRFVVSVAKQYQHYGLSLQDLINEGNIGLIIAAQRFDETRGFKFISYAVWWIRQCIMQAIAEHSRLIRLPINRSNQVDKVKRAYAYLEQELGRAPTVEEIAHLTAMSEEEVANALRHSMRHASIDSPIDGEGDTVLQDLIADATIPQPDKRLIDEGLRQEIEDVLCCLPKREADVIRYYYGIGVEPLSLDELAERFGISRERVRQLREKAIAKLRTHPKTNRLKKYLA